MGDKLIGISGFSSDDWIGEVYPKNIKKQVMHGDFSSGVSSFDIQVKRTGRDKTYLATC